MPLYLFRKLLNGPGLRSTSRFRLKILSNNTSDVGAKPTARTTATRTVLRRRLVPVSMRHPLVQLRDRGDDDEQQSADPDDIYLAAGSDPCGNWALSQRALASQRDHVGTQRHYGGQEGQ